MGYKRIVRQTAVTAGGQATVQACPANATRVVLVFLPTSAGVQAFVGIDPAGSYTTMGAVAAGNFGYPLRFTRDLDYDLVTQAWYHSSNGTGLVPSLMVLEVLEVPDDRDQDAGPVRPVAAPIPGTVPGDVESPDPAHELILRLRDSVNQLREC